MEANRLPVELELERELKLELEKLEQIFSEDDLNFDSISDLSQLRRKHSGHHRSSLSTFELAEAEGEKELLNDKVQTLQVKTEELFKQNEEICRVNNELSSQNDQMKREITELRKKIIDINLGNDTKESNNCTDLKYDDLETKLVETKIALAKALGSKEDLLLAKDYLLKELEQERFHRQMAEKERDVYSAAYESSLAHFDKWVRAKKSSTRSK